MQPSGRAFPTGFLPHYQSTPNTAAFQPSVFSTSPTTVKEPGAFPVKSAPPPPPPPPRLTGGGASQLSFSTSSLSPQDMAELSTAATAADAVWGFHRMLSSPLALHRFHPEIINYSSRQEGMQGCESILRCSFGALMMMTTPSPAPSFPNNTLLSLERNSTRETPTAATSTHGESQLPASSLFLRSHSNELLHNQCFSPRYCQLAAGVIAEVELGVSSLLRESCQELESSSSSASPPDEGQDNLNKSDFFLKDELFILKGLYIHKVQSSLPRRVRQALAQQLVSAPAISKEAVEGALLYSFDVCYFILRLLTTKHSARAYRNEENEQQQQQRHVFDLEVDKAVEVLGQRLSRSGSACQSALMVCMLVAARCMAATPNAPRGVQHSDSLFMSSAASFTATQTGYSSSSSVEGISGFKEWFAQHYSLVMSVFLALPPTASLTVLKQMVNVTPEAPLRKLDIDKRLSAETQKQEDETPSASSLRWYDALHSLVVQTQSQQAMGAAGQPQALYVQLLLEGLRREQALHEASEQIVVSEHVEGPAEEINETVVDSQGEHRQTVVPSPQALSSSTLPPSTSLPPPPPTDQSQVAQPQESLFKRSTLEAVAWCGSMETVFFSLTSLANAPNTSIMVIAQIFGVLEDCLSATAPSRDARYRVRRHIMDVFLSTYSGQHLDAFVRDTLDILLSTWEACETTAVRCCFREVAMGVQDRLEAAITARTMKSDHHHHK